jgi:hypothetical protein
MASGKVIAEWTYGDERYRLVSGNGEDVLERGDRDAAGGDRWVQVPVGYTDTTAHYLIDGIKKIAAARDAVADTMSYAKGARKG